MAYPVTLNGRTYTLADFEGTNYVDGFPDALEDFVTQAGNIYSSTSTTSNSIGAGSKTFTIVSGKPYQVGTPLRIADTAAPTTNWMDGIVTSYSGTTLVVSSVSYSGSGTKTAWSINIGGGGVSYTGTLPVAQGGTGATTALAARTNLGVGTGDSPTFAGIDVTGTVTADGLTVDASAGAILSLNGYTASQNTEVQLVAFREDVSTSKSILDIKTNNGTSLVKRARFDWDGDISFYEHTGTTAKFFWDSSAESLGIGTSSPSAGLLTLSGVDGSSSAGIYFNNTTATNGKSYSLSSGNSGEFMLYDRTSDAYRLFVNTSGNVGIGTSSPSSILDVKSAAPIFGLETTGTVSAGGTVYSELKDSTGTVFTSGFAGLANCYQFSTTAAAGFMRFLTGAQAEALRIDASGHLIAPYGITLGTAVGTYAAANTLDDYEEGTWTPNIGGTATYNHQIANYTKVGRVVTVQFDIDVNAIGSGSTGQLSGLPFTSQNINAPQVGAISYFEDIATACVFLGVYIDNNAQTMQFTGGDSSATTISRNAFAVFGDNTRIIGTVTYMTN
jgi:hypothetical protein